VQMRALRWAASHLDPEPGEPSASAAEQKKV
jgi:hypothetical protein